MCGLNIEAIEKRKSIEKAVSNAEAEIIKERIRAFDMEELKIIMQEIPDNIIFAELMKRFTDIRGKLALIDAIMES